ncbi:DNA polymerase III subunit epsilon [Acidithiobacillus sp. CV18-2]|uniref:DNA polymerase III subunit epsilon n=1 Tax=Igneacidithiobacillus copahuensis TaxID=2724909 RepID=A0AAE2YMU0_9PROT|nr:DNA polymerase III subunit epsilon [Igneacidithiobacillus copahuensis]MBU2754878.1 DNA polymerase III subunit epsilon [Acidithiobacillus sp. CV18-3]MBU2756574.1 DNA polymerase III subunit epsilon [Acidithiobacillus sp. BN09-2]MBU2777174.1 DNA polymerase III subunit epsilon [Acidithiobacillus sp. CV18-2]MBU2796105.1 DNA polymerase III subunit epsilon [Acidithiobacillus sp. VAN18-2]MBU2800013.1 DNA polymerase III subunit epsilon [Acidithiobacillus sp. VAN18-4]UTV80377.1 DNA polymerase III su
MRQIVLDTETTGLDPSKGHRVIEIGAVEIIDRRLTGNNFHVYLNPERPCDPDAVRIHGLTDEFLQDKPLFADLAEDFLAYLGSDELIIHNAPFDIGFLSAELGLVQRSKLQNPVIDTLVEARRRFPGQKNDLDTLCRRYAVDNSQRSLHGALLDCELLAEVYLAMSGGQVDMGLMDAAPTDATGKGRSLPAVRPQGRLRVISASPEEKAAHAAYLAGMGNALWEKV